MENEEGEGMEADPIICPLCNNNLVKRNSRFGEFWGCSNYPNCTYSQSLKMEKHDIINRQSAKLEREATKFLKQRGYSANGLK